MSLYLVSGFFLPSFLTDSNSGNQLTTYRKKEKGLVEQSTKKYK